MRPRFNNGWDIPSFLAAVVVLGSTTLAASPNAMQSGLIVCEEFTGENTCGRAGRTATIELAFVSDKIEVRVERPGETTRKDIVWGRSTTDAIVRLTSDKFQLYDFQTLFAYDLTGELAYIGIAFIGDKLQVLLKGQYYPEFPFEVPHNFNPCTEWDPKYVLDVHRLDTIIIRYPKEFINGTLQTPMKCIESAFNDVAVTSDSSNGISYLKDNGIVTGYEDGSYRLQNPINRAEFTKIIVGAAFSGSTLSAVDCFPDVREADWFSQYVCFAQKRGVVSGHDDGFFRPADHVNAAEAVKIIAEAFDLNVNDDTGDRWYQKYWQTLDEIDSLPPTVREPGQLLTRGEMADLVYRVMQHKEEQSEVMGKQEGSSKQKAPTEAGAS